MNRRTLFSAIGAACIPSLVTAEIQPDQNGPMGQDRRQWFKLTDNRWVPVEFSEVKPKDVILSMDIRNGCLESVEMFEVLRPVSSNSVEISVYQAVKWT